MSTASIETHVSETPAATEGGITHSATNGSPATPAPEICSVTKVSVPTESSPPAPRAEGIIERGTAGLTKLITGAGWLLLRGATRVKEGAEDMWSEAQTIRRGRQG